MRHCLLQPFLFFFVTVTFAQAASDSFNINQVVDSSDFNPPTTPMNLVAIPVAQSQIDVSWDVSIDDIALGGYQVFRGGLQIATTTLTTYSDSGLIASTSYSYSVTAFDTSLNFSTSSAIVSTSTLAVTPTSTATSSPAASGKGRFSTELLTLDVTPSTHSVLMQWGTSRYAQYELRWGRTVSYELGFVTNEIFRKEHSTVITNLEPATTYAYKLIGYDRDGRATVLSESNFITSTLPDTVAPANVSNLTVSVDGNRAYLSWDIPKDDDFSHVRIVRSPLFYPNDPHDGFIAYVGPSESFVDTYDFFENSRLYYTVFSYDQSGNISSGAVVTAQPVFADTALPPNQDASSTRIALRVEDILVIQNNTIIPSFEEGFSIDADTPFTIRIPYELLPEHLKTITVTLTHPIEQARTFSFLLRVNKDKTAYEAVVSPLKTPGVFQTLFSIYDFDTKILTTVTTEMRVVSAEKDIVLMPFEAGRAGILSVFLLVMLILLTGFTWFVFRKKEKEETT